MEQPYQGNAIIEDNFSEIQIIIPSKKNWFAIIFMMAWLGMWCIGELSAIGFATGIFAGSFPSLFMLFWFIGWTIGGFVVANVLFWSLKGKEIITIGNNLLKIEKKGTLIFKPKTYDLNEVKNIRIQDDSFDSGLWQRRNGTLDVFNKAGVIRFDYGMQTVKFAGGIDEAEAKFIIEKLKNRHFLSEKNYQ